MGKDSEHVIKHKFTELENLNIIEFGLKSAPICVNVRTDRLGS